MKIGDFARAGQVSVRMLRHYDQLGLLPPAHVDPWTGHRSYEPSQLHRLDRIVALNQLGFRLDDVATLLDDDVDGPEFADRLRERRAALAAEAHAVHLRLADVARRLHHIESEGTMSEHEYVIKRLPASRILGLRGHVGSQPEIEPVIGPMFGRVAAAITAAGGCPETGVGTYDFTDEGCAFVAGYLYAGDGIDGFEVVDLPACEAATTVHLGAMATIHETWAALDRHVGENGWAFAGPCREIYLEAGDGSDRPDDQSTWVTELQQPITR